MNHLDLHGKVCLITGVTNGIGEAATRALAGMGAEVIGVGRNPLKCAQVERSIREQSGNPHVTFLLADLSDFEQVAELADEIRQRWSALHVLINNAGAFFLRRQLNRQGIEMTFALNHLSYFLLTNLLLDRLIASAPARIVIVASGAHNSGRLHFEDLNLTRRYNGWKAYAQSKLANIMFTYELHRRLEGRGVMVNCMTPGFVATGIGKNNGVLVRLALWPLHRLGAQKPEEGARTVLYLAASPEVEGISGKYFIAENPVSSSPASYDAEAARRLWQVSETLVHTAHTGFPAGG